MSPANYDKSKWVLVDGNSAYALFHAKKDIHVGMIAEYADGDWDHNDEGDYTAMVEKFRRLSGALEPVQPVTVTVTVPAPANPYAGNPMFGRF